MQFILNFYDKVRQILIFGDEGGVVSQFIWCKSYKFNSKIPCEGFILRSRKVRGAGTDLKMCNCCWARYETVILCIPLFDHGHVLVHISFDQERNMAHFTSISAFVSISFVYFFD